jgi:hypothetical protein
MSYLNQGVPGIVPSGGYQIDVKDTTNTYDDPKFQAFVEQKAKRALLSSFFFER